MHLLACRSREATLSTLTIDNVINLSRHDNLSGSFEGVEQFQHGQQTAPTFNTGLQVVQNKVTAHPSNKKGGPRLLRTSPRLLLHKSDVSLGSSL